ncbi:LCP family protein [Cellulomonas sp. ATA003]|uniref:LCP family protein n=1 Tax=Cellulomonas sp. ATA003 TaxID=3073064 RepID=UPI002872CB51|nr:LCP family protein [Cellulomonas sp. ATA003]WNB85205.1 LCP family protein [Cellulomonas sp. ATA003]
MWALQNRLAGNIEHLGDPFADLPDRPPPGTTTGTPTDGAPAGTPATDATEDGALDLLVVGSDSRISAGDPSQWERGAQRTDAIMLVHLPADRQGAYVMSIPRDSWVPVPGYGEAKINAAFSFGGPSLLIQTVEGLTSVRIDHFAVTDFESFTDITDELGGVRITLKQDLLSGGRLVLPAGEHLMSGEEALAYVRQRQGLARGDFDRVHRQQAWMRAIFARMRNEQTLQNPTKSLPFLDTVTRSIAADDGLTRDVLNDLVDRVDGLGSNDIGFFTVPVAGTGRSPDGAQSIVRLDRPAFDELMAAVAADDVAGYLAAHPDDVDLLPPIAS